MNETFRPGESIHNACVGSNGSADLETYSEGYHESVMTLFDKIDSNRSCIDLLIYPLAYSARHRIELLLKQQILILAKMKTVYDSSYSYKVIATHEISSLWADLKKIAAIDERYADILKRCESTIGNFAEIDDNGESFRYPFANTGARHLNDIHCIDIRNFKSKYIELNENLEYLVYLTDSLYREYSQRSVVGSLSRMQISLIANDLLPVSNWNEKEFDQNKQEIKKKFGIGSKLLSEVISFIKKHREFSLLIGREIRLPHISEEAVVWFFKKHTEFESELSTKKYLDIVNKNIESIYMHLGAECIAGLAMLYDIGYFNLYSEEFDPGFDEKINEDSRFLIRFYLLENGIVKEKIKRGLLTTGQRTLLEALSASGL